MATTVGASLASSKLAVTQDDLHLVGLSVDQLVIRFDQAAFDKLLTADRVKANKARKHRHKARATASRLIIAASPSHGSQRRRAASLLNNEPISASVRSHICRPMREIEIPGD